VSGKGKGLAYARQKPHWGFAFKQAQEQAGNLKCIHNAPGEVEKKAHSAIPFQASQFDNSQRERILNQKGCEESQERSAGKKEFRGGPECLIQIKNSLTQKEDEEDNC